MHYQKKNTFTAKRSSAKNGIQCYEEYSQKREVEEEVAAIRSSGTKRKAETEEWEMATPKQGLKESTNV